MVQTQSMVEYTQPASGGCLVSTEGRELPLLGAVLEADACGGIARVTLRQTFENTYDEPLRVSYTLPLPADGAVSGFSFQVGDEQITGRVEDRDGARRRFEDALVGGHSAALLEQDRSSVFRQEVGNIPAHASVGVEVIVDQPLAWLREGAWEWRFPTVVGPRYLGEEGRVQDAQRVSVDVDPGGTSPRMALALTIRDAITPQARPESPSHVLTIEEAPDRNAQIRFGTEAGVRLDRDVVVRWPVATRTPGATIDLARPQSNESHGRHAYGLLTLVPPVPEVKARPVARDLIILVDTSGSMTGEPIEQAQAVVRTLVGGLSDQDRLELIEFSWKHSRWSRRPVHATEANKRKAFAWIDGLKAGGGTEMTRAILDALRPLGGNAQRQVLLVTDGMIGFESEIMARIQADLPSGSRLHTLGVGSAVNRSLTAAAARAGRGTELILAPDEDPGPGAARMCAAMQDPLIVGLTLSGDALAGHAPEKLPDMYAGMPARIGVALLPGGGMLRVTGNTEQGAYRQTLEIPAIEPARGAAAVTALYGREAIEDLEARGAAGESVDPEIMRIGIDFQIASRLTSWVAVSDDPTVDPRDPTRREVIPQELPYGMSIERLGLRSAAPAHHAAPGPPLVLYQRLLASDRVLRRRASLREERAPSMLDEVGAAPPAEPATPGLEGRLVQTTDDRIVVEVDLTAELDWHCPRSFEVLIEDGEIVSAGSIKVLKDSTTRNGRLAAGQILRLVLERPDDVEQLRFLVARGRHGLRIELVHG